MKAKRIIKAGRRRKQGAREPNGRVQRLTQEQTEEQIMSVALAQRERVMPPGTPKKALRDQKAGDVFGRLLLTEQITPDQYHAGLVWRDTFLAFARVMGVPLPRTLGTLAKVGHIPGYDESDIPKDVADGIKRRHRDIEAALFDQFRDHQDMRSALVNVILMDHQPGDLVLGNLRSALNVISRRCVAPVNRPSVDIPVRPMS